MQASRRIDHDDVYTTGDSCLNGIERYCARVGLGSADDHFDL